MKIAAQDFGERPVILAPMEDVTDGVFRKMCRKYGADLVFTEFVSSDALVRKVNRTMQKIELDPEERPVAIQLYGKDPDTMAEAARMVEEAKPELIDINFGCPARKIAMKGAGAGLLKDIPLLLKITEAVVEAVNTPVTVKTRLGWDSEGKHIKDVAVQLQNVGIKALTIHGRTRDQMYTGNADWTLIKEVKAMPRITIPIIGNGDIETPDDAMNAFKKYGVDAIMVGRASIGAPWVFKEITDYLKHGKNTLFTREEKLAVLKKLLHDNCELLGEVRGILHTRRHLAATPLFKNLENFRPLRIQMLRADTQTEIWSVLDKISQRYFA